MSKIDTIFRSIEHIVQLLYDRKFEGVCPTDLILTLTLLKEHYKDDPLVLISLSTIENFRHGWAHATYRSVSGMDIALNIIAKEIEAVSRSNVTLSLLIMTTRQLVNELYSDEEGDVVAQLVVKNDFPALGEDSSTIKEVVELSAKASEYKPLTVTDSRFRPRSLEEYKNDLGYWLKGRPMRMLEGKYAGKLGKVIKYNGTVVWVHFEGETDPRPVKKQFRVEVLR